MFNKDELVFQLVLDKRNNLKKKYNLLKNDLHMETYSYGKGRVLKDEEMNKVKLSRVKFIRAKIRKVEDGLNKFN